MGDGEVLLGVDDATWRLLQIVEVEICDVDNGCEIVLSIGCSI